MISAEEIGRWAFFGGVGAVLTLIIQKMRSRLSIIKWQHTWYAIANKDWSDPAAGKLKVTLNGHPVGYLWQSDVVISNESGRDLENFEIVMRFGAGQGPEQVVVHHSAKIVTQVYFLELSDRYRGIVEQAQELTAKDERTEEETAYIAQTAAARGIAVPVLNRDQRIEAKFVISTIGEYPFVTVTSPSIGLKVLPKPHIPLVRNERWEIPFPQAAYLGAFLNLFVVSGAYYAFGPSWLMVVFILLSTSFATYYGFGVIALFRAGRSLFS